MRISLIIWVRRICWNQNWFYCYERRLEWIRQHKSLFWRGSCRRLGKTCRSSCCFRGVQVLVSEGKRRLFEECSEEYKEYYKKGYQTDVDRIVIQKDTVTFFKNGKEYSGKYTYDGYEILTYDAGNRGVRYIFKLAKKAEGLPQYIQFSDHSIYPTKASHYHLYWGDDREALLDEVKNWPTYYPSKMDGHDIAHEMMAH